LLIRVWITMCELLVPFIIALWFSKTLYDLVSLHKMRRKILHYYRRAIMSLNTKMANDAASLA